MTNAKQLLHLVDLIYESASTPDRWPTFLEVFTRHLESSVSSFTLHDEKNAEYNLPAQFGMSQESVDTYLEHFAPQDELFRQAAPRLRTGWVPASHEFVDYSALKKTEFFNDFMVPERLIYECGGVIHHSDSRSIVITTLRDEKRGPFGKPQKALISSLIPHLQRASQIHFLLTDLKCANLALASALDRLAKGIILVGANARLFYANRRANDILHRERPLAIHNGAVVAIGPMQDRLQKLIHACANPGASLASAGGVLKLHSVNPHEDLVITVCHCRLPHLFGTSRAVALIIDSPRTALEPEPDLLRHLYRLTPAEAELTLLLGRDLTLSIAAQHRGVSLNTAKTQLKAVYVKLGISKQKQLIRLLASLTPRHPNG